MRKKLLNRWVALFICAAPFLTTSLHAQQTLSQVNGWNAYVHLPSSYASNPTATYPTIIFFPGLGEVGTNANALISNGPGAYITQGWNGNVVVDGNTIEFIVISLQPPSAFPNEGLMNTRIQTLKSLYRINPNKLYLTGLSHGGWCSSTFVTGDPMAGPYTYASQIAAVVTVEGMIPDDNQPYPNLFDNFANSGGRYLGFEQALDGRDTRTVVDRMNLTVPNSAVYVQTSFGNGGHCCWNQFYGGQGNQPGNFMLQGVNQNLYQWLARQSLGPAANVAPTANAGTDKVVTLPVSMTTLTGSGTDPDGTIAGYTWTQVSGPAPAVIVSPSSAQTDILSLVQGVYKFELKVTDNAGATGRDTAMVTSVSSGNQSPIANAGTDITVMLPTNTTILSGSGTDPDGSIAGYSWTQVSGPNTATIVSPGMPSTTVMALVLGTYKFALKVTDNSGAVTSDTVNVNVNQIACNTNAPVTYLLNYTVPGEIYRPNGTMWKGGDTIKITGTSYSAIEFYNIGGDPCRPLVIMPQTTVVTPVFRFKGKCHNIKLWGGNTQYGIKVNGAMAITSCDHIEINNVECTGGSNGVYCKQDPDYLDPTTWFSSGYVMSTFKFRNMWIHDVDGEGMYIGITQPDGVVRTKPDGTDTTIVPIRLDSVEVSNCLVERTNWDGIQLSNARGGNKIFNNTVRNYGLINMSSQQAGIILGGNCSGDVYNNTITKGTGNGMELFGYGVINAYNNVLDSCGYDGTANGQQSMYASDFLISTENNPKQTINAYGNAVNHPKTSGAIFITDYYNNSFPSSVYNNTFCIPGALANWQFTYLKLNVYGSLNNNNTLYCGTTYPPVANAGADQMITLPVSSVTLTGSGTDPDGTVVAYQWTKVAGPAAGTIVTPAAATSIVNGLVAGVYKFELLVTDNSGATGKDTIQVTVNPVANQAPVANAGADLSITLPVNTAALIGTGTDADGTITSYLWTKISGPATGSILNATSANATANSLVQGIYKFELKVTDNNGATGKDTIQVTVNPVANQAPVANAGADLSITLPVNTAALNGTGTDADGTITSYLWTKISGPATGTILNATSANATANSLVQGIYKFELKVTDNNGATGKDTMQLTVNAAIPPPNQAPSANAGADIIITLPVNSSALNGSGTDPDGTISSYQWTKVSGPAAGSISNSTSANATANALVVGTYKFELLVTDNNGATARDTMQITVNPVPNQSPTVNAGTDITITLPVNSTVLNGVAADPDGTIASYLWVNISGPGTVTMVNANTATPTVSGLVEGVYLFELQVTDNSGATATDEMLVIVNPAVPPAPNQLPTANAGVDKVLTLPNSSTTLFGSGTDPDGTIAGYHWTKISGPAGLLFQNPNVANTGVSGFTQGVYLFELMVTDNNGGTDTDTMQVTVNPAPNQLPVANAGNDITITLPVNTASLNGSGTDPDGTITGYLWTKISGPAAGVVTNSTLAAATASPLVVGVYLFELKVTDNSGASAKDTVQVTVNPAPNQPPTANAGSDATITLPTNSTVLVGMGTDPDGTITAFQWTKISGPAAGTITFPAAANTTITALVQGVYKFELKVTDNNGATGKDTMQVTVNAAIPPPNQAPSANAGQDISITLPVNTAALNGTGTDPDGTISAYLWTKITGPAAGTILNSTSANATASALVQGVYKFELKVTDNNGAIARDTMQLTVNAAIPPPNQAPVANAGPDKVITLPTNTTSLNGSGTDPDGTIVSYLWTKISGPAAGSITNATSAAATANSLVQGVYKFELRVTDNSGAIGKDTMQLTVNPAPNIPPVANAGLDQNLTLPANASTLTGSGTDADGTITAYQWTKISGPSVTIANPASAVTGISALVQGVYKFELKVTDNNGATDRDTVQVSVNAAPPPPNQRPVAHAGNDIDIYLPVNATILSGSGTDADGTITAYQWTIISGPASHTLINASFAQTDLQDLGQGIYEAELTVTDNNGATGKDTVKINVGSARVDPGEFVKIYPNPVVDELNISINTAKTDRKLFLVVMDMKGTIVIQKEIMIMQNVQLEKINMSRYAKGEYILKLRSDGQKTISEKLIKL